MLWIYSDVRGLWMAVCFESTFVYDKKYMQVQMTKIHASQGKS